MTFVSLKTLFLPRIRSVRTESFLFLTFYYLKCIIEFVSRLLFSPTGTPGPPYNLTITEVSKTHVDLKWEAPQNDGGRPVLR